MKWARFESYLKHIFCILLPRMMVQIHGMTLPWDLPHLVTFHCHPSALGLLLYKTVWEITRNTKIPTQPMLQLQFG